MKRLLIADDMDEYVQLLKTDLKVQSREIISKGMRTFTVEEAKRFWPSTSPTWPSAASSSPRGLP